MHAFLWSRWGHARSRVLPGYTTSDGLLENDAGGRRGPGLETTSTDCAALLERPVRYPTWAPSWAGDRGSRRGAAGRWQARVRQSNCRCACAHSLGRWCDCGYRCAPGPRQRAGLWHEQRRRCVGNELGAIPGERRLPRRLLASGRRVASRSAGQHSLNIRREPGGDMPPGSRCVVCCALPLRRRLPARGRRLVELLLLRGALPAVTDDCPRSRSG